MQCIILESHSTNASRKPCKLEYPKSELIEIAQDILVMVFVCSQSMVCQTGKRGSTI